MLERTEYMPLEYYKKQKWSGSYQGMRFLFRKVEEIHTELVDGEEKEEKEVFLEAVVWKEPYSYEATPEEEHENDFRSVKKEEKLPLNGWKKRMTVIRMSGSGQ